MKSNSFTNQSAGLKQTTKITRNNFIKPSLVALAVAQSLSMATVEAATIHVGGAQGAGCDLDTAIISANNDRRQLNTTCVAGNGDDIIELHQDIILSEPRSLPLTGGLKEIFMGVSIVTSNITINGNGHTISRDPAAAEFGIITVLDADELVLNDLTVSNGAANPENKSFYIDGNLVFRQGAAILTQASDLVLNNVTISNNSGGPAIHQSSGSSVINDSVLTGNETAFDGFGNAVTVSQSSITNNSGYGLSLSEFEDLNITDSSIDNNESGVLVRGTFDNNGGAVNISNSSISNNLGFISLDIWYPTTEVNITDSVISNNRSGVFMIGSDIPIAIDNSDISNNKSGGGIGIYNFNDGLASASVTLSNSTVTDNTARGVGGGIYLHTARTKTVPLTVINSTISGNSASYFGGGIYLGDLPHGEDPVELNVINSTIVNNVAGKQGGGIHAGHDDDLNISNSIVAGNSATDFGADISHVSLFGLPFTGFVETNNNIFGSSLQSNFRAFDGFTPSSTDITATIDGSNPTAIDSIVGPLQDNGASTLTHALVAGSPAIDIADLDVCINEPVNGLDQRGETRGVDGFCDIGAYELNDSQPTIRLEATKASVYEGDVGDERKIVYTINLSPPQTERVTVDYQTMDETAFSGTDYQMRAGSITFAPGQTSRVRAITVLGDDVSESDETFKFVLSNPSGNVELDVDDAEMIGFILNEDGGNNDAPTISLEATRASVYEGDAGDQRKIVYTINLSSPQAEQVKVDYQTMDETAIGSVDYQIRDGLITFAPGQTSRIRAITVLGDDVSESDETFKFVLSNPSGNVELDVDDADATGFILNDDGGNNSLPTISLEATKSSVYEGGVGDQRKIIYTINLSSPQTEQVTVDFQTMDQTATGGVDYQIRAGSITFAPGQTSQVRTTTVLGDDVAEPNETFKFVLSSPSANAELDVDDADTIGTILNEDF